MWSAGSGKTAAKVFKNGRENLGDNTLNEPVPRRIQMLVRFLCPIRVQHLSGCFPDLIGRSSSCKLDCPPCTSLARAGLRAFFEQSFQRSPQSYSTNFIRSSCITGEKILTNSQTLKGEKILLYVPNKYAEQS